MYRIILFLVLIALAAAGAAWVADQPGDVVLTWGGWRATPSLPVFALLLGITIVAAMLAVERPARAVAHAGTDPAQPARTPSGARPSCHHPRAARDRPRRCRRRARACRGRAPPCRERSAGAAAARAIGAARRRPRRRATRVSRHGRARGHAAVGPARTVHRGAARRRSGRRRHDRGGGAEAGAGLDLGVAGGARISLRQGRLERGAGHPRQQSRLRPDRQGGLSASARRAADGARAGTGKGRPRPVARQRDGSDQAGADPGAGRGAGQQISRARRIRCGARCGSWRRRGWRSRIPISPTPMRM